MELQKRHVEKICLNKKLYLIRQYSIRNVTHVGKR